METERKYKPYAVFGSDFDLDKHQREIEDAYQEAQQEKYIEAKKNRRLGRTAIAATLSELNTLK
jgi:hypothetical protein